MLENVHNIINNFMNNYCLFLEKLTLVSASGAKPFDYPQAVVCVHDYMCNCVMQAVFTFNPYLLI